MLFFDWIDEIDFNNLILVVVCSAQDSTEVVKSVLRIIQ